MTTINTTVSILLMGKIRRITANLPEALLDSAMDVTGKGITDTIVEGLEQLKRRRAYDKLISLRGKVQLNLDIDELRGRDR